MKKQIKQAAKGAAIVAAKGEVKAQAKATLEHRVNSNSLRVALMDAGKAGLMAIGSYVASKVEVNALQASLDACEKGSKIAFTSKGDDAVIVITGNKGTLARKGRVSSCGKYVEVTNGAQRGIVSLAILDGTDKGSVKVFTLSAFAKHALTLEKSTFVRKGDNATFAGRIITGDKYSALIYAHGDKLALVDVETQSNTYNAHVLGAHGVAKEKAESLAKATEAMLAKVSK